MNRKNNMDRKSNMRLAGVALVLAAGVLGCLVQSAASEGLVRLVGKGVWYLPYACVIGAVRCLVHRPSVCRR